MPSRIAATPGAGPAIVGRDAELQAVEGFLDAAAQGPALLRLEGDPGIGKTTLWWAAVARARDRGVRVLSARPAEAEGGLSFTGLTDLVDGVPDEEVARLPRPQRRALEVALLRAEPGEQAPDQRAIATAVLGLVRRLAAAAPLLLAVDDAQWLDRPTDAALAFVVRRLAGEPVGVVVSVRTVAELAPGFDAAMPPDRRQVLRVGTLSLGALHRLIRDRLDLVLPRPVLVRVEAACGGNPFHALEIARELQASGDLRAERIPVPEELAGLMAARIRRLPGPTRAALLEVAGLSRPTTRMVPERLLVPAEEADVVRIEPGGRVRFTHPLLASAVYDRAPEELRRELHRDLAARVSEPEERARHLALAATEPDEDAAAALERAADEAWGRGASGPAADLLDLAVRLTPAPGGAAGLDRRLRLAESLLAVGDISRGHEELGALLALDLDGDRRGRAVLAAAKFNWFDDLHRGRELLEQAIPLASDATLRARMHARLSWMHDHPDRSREHARAGLALVDEAREPSLHAYLAMQRAWAEFELGIADDAETVRRLAGRVRESPWEQSPVPYMFATAHCRWDDARESTLRALAVAREWGDEGAVAHALASLAAIACARGEVPAARGQAEAAEAMADATDMIVLKTFTGHVLLSILVVQGEADAARALDAEIRSRLPVRIGPIECALDSRAGQLELSLEHPAAAVAALSRAEATTRDLGVREPSQRFHGDLAEAVIASGDLGRADALVADLEERAGRFGLPWVVCVSLRCRGLLLAARGDLDGARASMDQALAAHDDLEMPVERARTELAAGRVERRARRWGPARRHLEAALAAFERMGAAAWAAQAEAELARVAARPPARADGLSATERQVADLVAQGLTNRQVADALFQSPKTVEAHLTRIYRKLGVSTRAALAGRMAADPPGGSRQT